MPLNKDEVNRNVLQFIRKGQWKNALDEMRKLLAEDKDDPMLTLRMGDVYLKLGDKQKAAMSYFRTASMFAAAGHNPKAIATYKMVLRVDPDYEGVQERLDLLASEPPRHARTFMPGAGRQATAPDKVIEVSEAPDPASVVAEAEDTGFVPAGQDIPLLSNIPREELVELLSRMRPSSYGKDGVIVKEGEEGDSLFIIKSGGVRVVTRVKGREVLLARLGECDFFGEVSFLTGRPRTADIIADEPSEILELDRGELDRVISKYPEVGTSLRMFHENRVEDTVSSIKALAKDLFA